MSRPSESEKTTTCAGTWAQPVSGILIQGAPHAGVITHHCQLEAENGHKICVCLCGYHWPKHLKRPA